MNLAHIHNIHMIGIGGIGMSGLARYFMHLGKSVTGYDRAPSGITDALSMEGADIHFTDDPSLVADYPDLVVYTPAIPLSHRQLIHFKNEQTPLKKRSEVLEWITENAFTIAVAGSHGKTTLTAMITHLLKDNGVDCTAFIGGIALNYQSNFVAGADDIMVIEADEYDRSFHRLRPDIAVITSIDSDHLDIYGSLDRLYADFQIFADRVKASGLLVTRNGLPVKLKEGVTVSYALHPPANVYAENIQRTEQGQVFSYRSGDELIENIVLHYPGLHNIENLVAAITVAGRFNISQGGIKKAAASFRGIKRRFEYILQTPEVVFIDDYAHHPEEIKRLMESVRDLYPDRHITCIFQPHLFSRTRDLADEFALSLDKADRVVLLDIYPAREEPVEGVTSALIFDKLSIKDKYMAGKSTIVDTLEDFSVDVLLTVGAGDIDQSVPLISNWLKTSYLPKVKAKNE